MNRFLVIVAALFALNVSAQPLPNLYNMVTRRYGGGARRHSEPDHHHVSMDYREGAALGRSAV